MNRKELIDNLTFLSASKQLEQLAAAEKLSAREFRQARLELERKLRPTIVLMEAVQTT